MFGRNREHVKILKHHRNAAVYIDGRYLHTDMKVSLKSKRGREIALETAEAIANAVNDIERTGQANQTGQTNQSGSPWPEGSVPAALAAEPPAT
jgi:hypothetical protein